MKQVALLKYLQRACAWIQPRINVARIAIVIETIALLVAVLMYCDQKIQNAELRASNAASEKRQVEARKPRPSIMSAEDGFRIKTLSDVPKNANLHVTNLGQGNCHDLCVAASFLEVQVTNDKNERIKQTLDPHPELALTFVTLTAGERRPIKGFPFSLAETSNPQSAIGYVTIECKDERGQQFFFLQRFAIIIDKIEGETVARFLFSSSEEVIPDFSRTVNGITPTRRVNAN